MKNKKPVFVDGGNEFDEKYLQQMVAELESGNTIAIYISCIGHSRTERVERAYKNKLIEKYGDKLYVMESGYYLSDLLYLKD